MELAESKNRFLRLLGWIRFSVKAITRLDWFKLITAVVALAGIMWTVYSGSRQLDDARQSRDDDRFDKAITRLAGSTAAERLSGVAGLGLYLEPQQKPRHRPTLRFLVSALAGEPDPTVRGQLLDTLSSLRTPQISQADLNDALERLRDRNRDLYAQLQAGFLEKLRRDGSKLPESDYDETHILPNSDSQLAPLRERLLLSLH
jgi:hypothetical protein